MRRAIRLGLGLMVLLGLVRATAFLVYACATLPTPFEAHFLEAKMVHLAWRVRAGLPLYPDWRGFPYVSNFYSPCYFLLVGGLGRAAGAGLDGLFFIGRGVTFAAALLTTAVLGGAVGRRHGRWAGLAAAAVSLGATPMIGFAVMVRSDLMAELLGLVGFLLSGRRSRRWCAAGCGLLVAAALTKQTAGVFLLARRSRCMPRAGGPAPAPSWPVASACWGRSSRRSRAWGSRTSSPPCSARGGPPSTWPPGG